MKEEGKLLPKATKEVLKKKEKKIVKAAVMRRAKKRAINLKKKMNKR